jgi:hypothetical protein
VNNKKGVSRRQFLTGAGGAYLALPFLPSLLPRSAWGQTPTIPKRLVALWTGNGTCYKNWYPALDASKVIAPNVRETVLSSITGNISPILGSEISAFKSKLLLLRGMDGLASDGHNTEEILAAGYSPLGQIYSSQNISIDQVLAGSPKFYSKEPKARVLSLAGGDSRQENISYMNSGGSIVRAPLIIDMNIAFNTLFEGIGGTPADFEKAKLRNLSLVDRVFEDYKKVAASAQIGKSDKLRLDSHVNFVFELQKRIQASAPASGCVAPAKGSSIPSRGMNPATLEVSDVYITNMIDIAVAALRCDLTRSVNLMPWIYGNGFAFIPGAGDLHALSHKDNAISDVPLTAVQQYFVKKFAELVKKLNDVVEDTGDGSTLLDHTAVLWRQEFTGNGIHNHKKVDMPTIIAGGTKFLNSGRYVDYRTLGKTLSYPDYTWMGVPYNQVLVTLLQGFGLTPAEYEQSTGAGFGYYGVAGGRLFKEYGITDVVRRTPLFSVLKS